MIWVHSKQKAEGKEDFRKRHIEKAEKYLKEIQSKLNKRNLRTLEGIKKAVKKATLKVEKFIQVNITGPFNHEMRQILRIANKESQKTWNLETKWLRGGGRMS